MLGPTCRATSLCHTWDCRPVLQGKPSNISEGALLYKDEVMAESVAGVRQWPWLRTRSTGSSRGKLKRSTKSSFARQMQATPLTPCKPVQVLPTSSDCLESRAVLQQLTLYSCSWNNAMADNADIQRGLHAIYLPIQPIKPALEQGQAGRQLVGGVCKQHAAYLSSLTGYNSAVHSLGQG